ncbi:hypothetical protein ACFOLJ_27575 [Rugamonas sp. CCM 8940]|uniref:hypothetical protein n=1 Tax=Rugamonas sp. CCM 8940 TaxID=2765359 RepID=UPI0018F661EF|nr:hypothetical protein [Rugamonas sp. CCM 8940]MBJ7311232.1 hypothetical protein [Rugamonas sp. CCM 8940]
MKPLHGLAGLLLAGAVAWWSWPPHAGVMPLAPSAAQGGGAALAGAAPASAAGGQWFGAMADDGQELKRVPLPPIEGNRSAWLSMAEAREHGDQRTPPLQRDEAAPERASAAQLADPEAYRQYEQGQKQRMLSAYVTAAESELPALRADVERARAAGLPAADIAKVEEKIRRIEEQRRLVIKDNPGLASAPAPTRR